MGRRDQPCSERKFRKADSAREERSAVDRDVPYFQVNRDKEDRSQEYKWE